MFRRRKERPYNPVPGQLLLAIVAYGLSALALLGIYLLVNWGTRSLMGY